MDEFVSGSTAEVLGINLTECLHIFMIYRTTYYNWKKSTQKKGGRKLELDREDLEIKMKFLEIIKTICYVPGSRTFHTFMIRDYGKHVSIGRCRRIMNEMNLIPRNARPPEHKAKRKAGGHCHPCAAVENLICQAFYRGPRKIILTDITYLYINEYHNVIYLCVFYDCYTKEILGWSLQKNMKVDLVREAYDMMMEDHGDELRGTKVLIHSDQGSQYTSTTYKQLLSDEGFIQSMSRRGNSQDNAPMESFFGRMKERIMNLIALCPDYDTAKKLINGYMTKYNNIYQFSLAGLTPAEFYLYTKTGIYPLKEYYGVKSDELDKQKKLIETRIASAKKRGNEEREIYRRKRERELRILSQPPEDVVRQDQKLLQRKLDAEMTIQERAKEKIIMLNRLIEKTKTAINYIKTATASVIDDLRNPLHWNNYPELRYIYEMNGMY